MGLIEIDAKKTLHPHLRVFVSEGLGEFWPILFFVEKSLHLLLQTLLMIYYQIFVSFSFSISNRGSRQLRPSSVEPVGRYSQPKAP